MMLDGRVCGGYSAPPSPSHYQVYYPEYCTMLVCSELCQQGTVGSVPEPHDAVTPARHQVGPAPGRVATATLQEEQLGDGCAVLGLECGKHQHTLTCQF